MHGITGNELISRLHEFKTNPTLTGRVLLESLDKMDSIVDPTNPFVLLLETSVVNTASFNAESALLLRQQYPVLAQSFEDLYLHMSDKDYLDRFSKPSESVVTFMIALPTLEREWVWDAIENCHKVTIPRDTVIEVDGVSFMILYPIHIRRFVTGQVQVAYDSDIDSPLSTLKNSIIDYVTRLDDSQVKWLDFQVPVKQLLLSSIQTTYQKSIKFKKRLQLQDKFYYARVFHRNETDQPWNEMVTTHTDQVFDPDTPTAVLRVYEDVGQIGFLDVSIPVLYETKGLIMKSIRIDIYTTLGPLQLNMDNYPIERFKVSLNAVDVERDWDEYVAAAAKTSFLAFSHDIVSGGTPPISFKELRERVIFNGVNGRAIPISPTQLSADTSDLGFELIKNVDVVTNRLFLAIRKLPEPSNTRLLTSANIGIMTLTGSFEELENGGHAVVNGERCTVLPTALYRADNGVMRQVKEEELEDLLLNDAAQLANRVNEVQYLYTPFYYVLDDSDEEFAVRAYDLDRPSLRQLSFENQNETLQLVVNTGQYSVEKTEDGYELVFLTKSGAFYRDIDDSFVGLQLGFIPPGENKYACIEADLIGKTDEGDRIFSVKLNTNHDIDSEDRIYITNASMSSGANITIPALLDQTFDLFHYTTSLGNLYQPSIDDSQFANFLAPAGAAVMSRERIRCKLGYSLRNLWSRGREVPDGLNYKTYLTDVPATYTSDVFAKDPETGLSFKVVDGEITFEYLHRVGDNILDDEGNQVYLHRAGDLVLSPSNDPIPITGLSRRKEFDLLMVDGRYRFTNDVSFEKYRTELSATITDWVTETLDNLSDNLLEKTRVYFYPKTTLSMVRVYPDGGPLAIIPSEQSFKVNLFVPKEIYEDAEIRETLTDTTVRYLDSIVSNSSIIHNDMVIALRDLYGASVVTFTIEGLGGKDYQVVHVAEEHNRMCLKKRLVVLEDMSMIIQEDVTVNFHVLP